MERERTVKEMEAMCQLSGPARTTRRDFVRRGSVAAIAVVAAGTLTARASAGGSGELYVQGEFVLGPASDGIDPASQPVTLRLLVLPGDRVYPPAADFMPITGFVPTLRGWRLSTAEQQRTGLQAFDIGRTADPRRFTFEVVDKRNPLAARNYGVVLVVLSIGDDSGEATRALIERRGTWDLS
jgi:hypothetical protein